MRIEYSNAKAVIANSHDTKVDLVRLGVRCFEKIKVIGNPVFSKKHKDMVFLDEKLDHPFCRGVKKIILTVGRLHEQKNHKMLICAIVKVKESVPNACLVILGEGGEKENIINHISKKILATTCQLLVFKKTYILFVLLQILLFLHRIGKDLVMF